MLRRIRKWWLCRKYHICPVHGTLLTLHRAVYAPCFWTCDTCIAENEAKNIYREEFNQLARIEAAERLRKDWAIRGGR